MLNRNLRWGGFLLFTALILSLSCPALLAQTATGTISGMVTDTSGAVIPDVKVTVKNEGTGISREVRTNNEGIFSLPALPVGLYTLRVEQQGFSPAVVGGLKLDVDRVLRVNVVMKVGGVQESVLVVAEAEQLLKQETSDLGQIVNEATVANLPLNGREFWSLTLLTSGVTPGAAGVIGPAVGVRSLSVNGQRFDANLYVVDGFDNRELDSNQDNITPNLDSVAEFAVHTNTYSAALGSAAGAIISVTTKSGTNDLHGTLFEYFRNDVLDANNFFANARGLGKNPLRFNQFGGSIGGPIVRNKTFFFADYQGDRVRRGSVLTTTVPTLARRNGDFSDLLAGSSPVQLINPRTFAPVPGNIIPVIDMDPPALALAQLYPAPTQPGTTLNYSALLKNQLRRDAFSVRGDHYFGAGDLLSVRYYYLNSFATTPVAFGKTLGGPPMLGGTDDFKRNSITVGYIHTFSPTLLNEARFGWVTGPRNLLNTDHGTDLATQFGIPNVNFGTPLTSGLPTFQFLSGGSDIIGASFALPQFLKTTNYQFSDNVTMVRGNHKIQFGGQYVGRRFQVLQTIFPRGFYLYLGFSSIFSIGRAVPGADFADFLMGVPLTLLRDYMDKPANLRTYQYGLYFQDDYKATRRLTLNMGIRYDTYPPLLEADNLLTNFDPSTGTLVQAPNGKFGRRAKQTDRNNVAPRVGLSYALTADSKTLLRTGFGLFYFDSANVPATQPQLIYNPPNFYAQTGPGFPVLPPLSVGPPQLPPPPLTSPRGSVRYHPTDTVTSYSEQWNVNIQRALPWNTFAEVAYVGTRGLHLVRYSNMNQPFLDSTGTQVRPFGNQISGLRTWSTISSSTYHGLQAKLERRFSNGVQYLIAYTYAKSIDDNSTGVWGGIDTQFPQNNYDLKAERGLSAFDIRQRFVGSFIWEIPYFRKANNSVVRNVVGGWQVNGIITLQSGAHVTPIVSSPGNINPMFSDSTVSDLGSLRPNLIGNPNLPSGQRTVDHWYDVSAFDATFAGQPHNIETFGNAGRGTIEAPGLATTDLSFFKEVAITERCKLQFRSEFFNIFNRVNLDAPIRTVNLNGGKILTSRPAREIQLGLKILF